VDRLRKRLFITITLITIFETENTMKYHIYMMLAVDSAYMPKTATGKVSPLAGR